MEKCEYCREIAQINGFDSYRQYNATKKNIEQALLEGVLEKTGSNPFEICFKCRICNTVWVLAEPDFPIKGYFIQR